MIHGDLAPNEWGVGAPVTECRAAGPQPRVVGRIGPALDERSRGGRK
jgi:hypothetical protein